MKYALLVLTCLICVLTAFNAWQGKDIRKHLGLANDSIEQAISPPTEQELLYQSARKRLGKEYRFGVYDCSKFVQDVYADLGRRLPRVSTQQYQFVEVSNDTLYQYLIFFDTKWTSRVPNHLGIMTSDSTFIHNSSSKGVVEVKLSEYWVKKIYNPNAFKHKLIGIFNYVKERI